MTLGHTSVYLHIVSGVLLVGYALFWVVMVDGLRRTQGAVDCDRLLATLMNARWPLLGGALTLSTLGWLVLGALAATGGALLIGTGPAATAPAMSPVLIGKLALFLLLVAGHAAAVLWRHAWMFYVNGGLAVAVVLVSAFVA